MKTIHSLNGRRHPMGAIRLTPDRLRRAEQATRAYLGDEPMFEPHADIDEFERPGISAQLLTVLLVWAVSVPLALGLARLLAWVFR